MPLVSCARSYLVSRIWYSTKNWAGDHQPEAIQYYPKALPSIKAQCHKITSAAVPKAGGADKPRPWWECRNVRSQYLIRAIEKPVGDAVGQCKPGKSEGKVPPLFIRHVLGPCTFSSSANSVVNSIGKRRPSLTWVSHLVSKRKAYMCFHKRLDACLDLWLYNSEHDTIMIKWPPGIELSLQFRNGVLWNAPPQQRIFELGISIPFKL